MLTELCQELKNWFPVRDAAGEIVRYPGTYEITGGVLTAPFLLDGQYFRITGSIFNDGVHQHNTGGELQDETFVGAVWPMAIPKDVLQLSEEIQAWRDRYEGPDSAAMSPFSSESFGGYAYTKGAGAATNSGSNVTGWQNVFAVRMNAWRKL